MHGSTLSSSLKQDKELLQRIQDIVVHLQWECEQLSSVTGGLLQDFKQKEKGIEVRG